MNRLKFEALQSIINNLVIVGQLTNEQRDCLMMNKEFMIAVRPVIDGFFDKLEHGIDLQVDFEPIYQVMFAHL